MPSWTLKWDDDVLLDGTICHANPQGTALERFSSKPRLVLLAYHDDVHAFVYPLTTAKAKDAIAIDGGWLVIKQGLFRLPITCLHETDRRFSQFGRLKERIRRDLKKLEEDYEQPDSPLTQRGLDSLSSLRGSLPSPERRESASLHPKQLTDEELFQQFLDQFSDESK